MAKLQQKKLLEKRLQNVGLEENQFLIRLPTTLVRIMHINESIFLQHSSRDVAKSGCGECLKLSKVVPANDECIDFVRSKF